VASTRTSTLRVINRLPLVADVLDTRRSPIVEMCQAHKTNVLQNTGAGISEPAVKEQLSRILGSLFFRNSDRYTGLLQYVVDTAIHGDPALLKERLIGINVFARDPSYDTVKDNVVRIAAAEVRGRLVRYYALPEHRSELRIILSPGSYVPQFALPDMVQQHGVVDLDQSPLHKFWWPLVESLEPILIVLGPSLGIAQKRALRVSPESSNLYRKFSEQITLSDALTLSRIVSFFESCGKDYRVEMQDFVRFRDLRNGPAVLLGGVNNQWTMSFTEHLRFALKANRGCTRAWIRDRESPSRQPWKSDRSQATTAVTEDHAIIARVLKSETGQPLVIAGGYTVYGTSAAGEFVTNASYLDSIITASPSNWNLSNLQLVIATTVVRGISGPPRISATYQW
jgi:hypothetical protein